MTEWLENLPSGVELFWLAATLLAYRLCSEIHSRCGRSALLHPAIMAIGLLILLCHFSATDYSSYLRGALPIDLLLGPATVALAVPLFEQRRRIAAMARPLLLVSFSGAVAAASSALFIGWVCDLSRTAMLSLAPKSVTTPIAIGITQTLGGEPALAAGLVLLTGAIGVLMAPYIFRWLKVDDDQIRGFTLGISAHGFGTAFAFESSAMAGALAGLGMGLTGLLTAFLLPLLVALTGLV